MITAENAYFIKLGEGNRWASECLANGTLRLGYGEVPHDLCINHQWDDVLEVAQTFSRSTGAARSHTNQIVRFYESDEKTLWITFHGDRLRWCFAKSSVTLHSDQTKTRETLDGWHDADIKGNLLLKSSLSGRLLAVEGFMGTICGVRAIEYLLHKINATNEPYVANALAATSNLQSALIPVIQKLHPRDFETFVDLLFRQSGWQRVGVSGGTEQYIDLDLVSPVTGERIAVQVKSRADESTWKEYYEIYKEMRGFSRFYFVSHSPTKGLEKVAAESEDPTYTLWDANKVAMHAIRGGLTGWLLDKAA